jgi:hypothetical protein
MSDYFKSKVFDPLSKGKINTAYIGYRELQQFEPMASLLGLFSKDSADPLRQLTKPGLLTAMLTKMGYKEVVDRTFGYETFPATAKIADALTRYPMHAGTETLKGRANLKERNWTWVGAC